MSATAAPALVGFPDFVPRAPWWGGDLQTIRNYFLAKPEDLSPYAMERLEIAMPDGTGDRLVGYLSHPAAASRPLAILVHGLTGCSESLYILRTARHLLAAGHPVLRLNLRGAGVSRTLCRFQYHAGRTGDLRAALAALPARMTRRGVVLIGYSLGGNLVLKLLGEGTPAGVGAAVAISAPIDLAAAERAIRRWRNYPYQRHLLALIKEETLHPAAAVTAAEREAIESARTVFEFDDRFTAPRNGFADAADFYTRNSALRFLDAIRIPTLVIHALDDPWIPAASYLGYEWAANPALLPLLPRRGGHVGFNGKDPTVGWHDQCLLRFLGERLPQPALRRRAASTAE